MMRKRAMLLTLVVLVLTPLMAGCGGGGQKEITIGSKDFAEQYVLAEMYALLLEDAGFTVERKLGLAGTPVAQAALVNGEIDLYPEYTGTGLLTVLKLPVESDREVVYQKVKDGYAEQFDLVWLDPAPMNNAQALAVTQEVSDQYGITTISDMVANASDLIMVGPPEFPEREDGLPGLKKVYGKFELEEYRPVGKALRYEALANGALNLIVLEDDKGMFPPYQVAPVVRAEVLDEYPEIADILNELAPLLTSDTMRRLNYKVTGEQQEPIDVAREFLQQEGLLD
jgi:osmoprotectant transport system substrate-binding protein